MLFGQKLCRDCEPAQVNHFVIRNTSYLGLAFKPLLRPLDYILRVFIPPVSFSWFDKAGPLVLRVLAFLQIGRLQKDISPEDSDRTRALWEEAKKRGIEMVEYRLGPIKDLFIARWKNNTRCFDGLPRPIGPEAESLFWMDNKPKMRKHFIEKNIPVARGDSCFSEKRGVQIFNSLQKPVIAKPYTGSRSRHTTIHIETEKEFLQAFRKAKILSPLALIEEELIGFVYRGTLIGGKLIAVMRREPPHVVGDGIHTIQELVKKENERPERHGRTFHPLATDAEAEKELARQKLNWNSVLPKNKIATLNQKISRGIGASTTDVTDITHFENKKLFEKIGAELKDPIIGVDFIIEDISRPWQEQKKVGIIECNSLPFIDLHHYPLNGTPRNVAGALWDIIFPESKNNELKKIIVTN